MKTTPFIPPNAFGDEVATMTNGLRAEIVTYEHSENGISLYIVPGNEQLRELLRGLWKHGQMKKCNGVEQQSEGFAIQWRFEAKP